MNNVIQLELFKSKAKIKMEVFHLLNKEALRITAVRIVNLLCLVITIDITRNFRTTLSFRIQSIPATEKV
jgi:hypothetical protein